MKTLSDRFMIRAIDCMVRASSGVWQKPTAAGFPPNGVRLKTLTCQSSSSGITSPDAAGRGTVARSFDADTGASRFHESIECQLQRTFPGSKTPMEVERDRRRPVIVEMLQARAGFRPGDGVVVGRPPHRVGRPFWLAEPLVSLRQSITVQASVHERVDRLDVAPQRQGPGAGVGADLMAAVIEPRHRKLAPFPPIALEVGKI